MRWHAKPLNDKWSAVEQHAMRELLRWVKPPDEAPVGAPKTPDRTHRLLTAIANLPLWVMRALAYCWIFRRRIGQYLVRALRGDRETLTRIAWFVRSFMFGAKSRS